MKKGEIYEGIIEKVDFPNKGYVILEDQKILVKNGIPGQRVRFVIQKKRKNKAQGRILEVLEKSPLEKREPVCSSFPQCGGCMYQTMSYEEQLQMKDRQIRELLEVRRSSVTGIRWSSLLGMNIRMDRFPLDFTKKAVHMMY